jgi:hypothetical protein
MAFVYEVNGQKVAFQSEPTEADIDEAAAALGTTAKSTERPMKAGEAIGGAIETALGAISGAAAMPLGAAASLLTNNRTTPEAVMDRLTYQPRTEAGQRMTEGLGKAMDAAKIPPIIAGPLGLAGSGRHSRAALPAIQMTGTVAGNTARAAGEGVADAGRAVAAAPGQVVKGTINALKSDTPVASVKITEPTIEQAISPERHASGKAGMNTLGELATRMSDNNVPIEGRSLESAVERMVRGWREGVGKPLSGSGLQTYADIAGMFGAGVPFQGSLIKHGIPAAGKLLQPLRAVDPALLAEQAYREGRAAPTYDVFSGRRNDTTYIQPHDLNSNRTYTRPVEPSKMPGNKPAPVAEGTGVPPSAAPVVPAAPGSIEAKLQQMRAQIAARGDNGQEAQMGKREVASQQREAKQQSIDQVISEWGNVDSPSRQGIPTQPVDAVDMDNRTRGAVALMKKLGGTLDEIPSMEWLRDHGISENTFIQRVAKNSGASAISKRQRGNPNILGMMTEDDLPGGPVPVEDSSMTKAGSMEQPLTSEQYDQFGIIQSLNPTDEYHYVRRNGNNIEEIVKSTRRDRHLGVDEVVKNTVHQPDGAKIEITHTLKHNNGTVFNSGEPVVFISIKGMKIDGHPITVQQRTGVVTVNGFTPNHETFRVDWHTKAPGKGKVDIQYGGEHTGRLTKEQKAADMKWIKELDNPSPDGSPIWKPDF